MKKLDTSAISTTVAFPVKSGTLDHLQAAYTEAIAEGIKALIGSGYVTNKAYILSGCVNIGVHPAYDISAGAVFYNGEVYLVSAASFSVVNPSVAVGVLDTSFFSAVNADPVEFTDGVPRNVHQIRRVLVQSGLSGSGLANFLDWIDITKRIQGGIGDIKIWNPAAVGLTLTQAFNTGTGLGIHPYTLGWAICDGQNGTVDMGGLMPVGYKDADSDFNVPFTDTGGSKTVTLTADKLPASMPAQIDNAPRLSLATFEPSNENHGVVVVKNGGSSTIVPLGTEDAAITILNAGGGQAQNVMNPYRAVLWVQRIS